MAVPALGPPARLMFWGNLLLIACCAFYLAWWLLAFRPAGAVKGFRSGWLLLPAFAAGLAAVVLILRGAAAGPGNRELFPGAWILWGGAAAYVLLLAVTVLLFRRPVTTELLLIVGWAMLSFGELRGLCGAGRLAAGEALAFAAAVVLAGCIDLVCYVLYMRLDPRGAYLAGTIPLLLAALVMAALTLRLAL